MAIANVQTEGSWIRVYDERSKRISQMSAFNIELAAVGGDFFVTLEGSWLRTYDENCKRIAQMSLSGVQIRNAAGQTFTTREGNRRPRKSLILGTSMKLEQISRG